MPHVRYRRRSTGEILTLDPGDLVGAGGEARVLAAGPEYVAKIFREPDAGRIAKLRVMLANPPEIPIGNNGHVMIAWPLDLLENPETGEAHGFLMNRVNDTRLLIDFYNPKSRQLVAPGFQFAYLLRAARNLAVAVAALHARGYVIGDINESNILSKDTALVTFVDMDSIQVIDPDTKNVYRCGVGKIEYTAPEVQGLDFESYDRTLEHDRFALGVLIFQLLMEGIHPFVGTPTTLVEDQPIGIRIQKGLYPHHSTRDVGYEPRKVTPTLQTLHPKLQELFQRCFEAGHDDPAMRPDAIAWADAIQEAEEALMTCGRNAQHLYSDHQAKCPWCERAARLGGYDSFPPRAGQRDAPKLEAMVSKRHLREQREQRAHAWSRISAAVLPLLVILFGVVAWSLSQDNDPVRAEVVNKKAGAPGAKSTSKGSESRSARTDGDPAAAETEHEQRPKVHEDARIDEADLEFESQLEAEGKAAKPDQPERPGGVLSPSVDAVRAGYIQMRNFKDDNTKVAYFLTGRLAGAQVYAVVPASDALWVSTDRGLLRCDPKRNSWRLYDPNLDYGEFHYRSLDVGDGKVVATLSDPGKATRLLDPGRSTWVEVASPAQCVALDDSFLWCGTRRGVLKVSVHGGRPLVFDKKSGSLPSDEVQAIQVRNEMLWVATPAGVSRFDTRRGAWRTFTDMHGLASASAVDLDIDKNAVWVAHGAAGRGISRFDLATESWQVLRRSTTQNGAKGTIELAARCLAMESDRNLWFGGAGDSGLYWYGVTSKRGVRLLRFAQREVTDIAVGHGSVWALFSPQQRGVGEAVVVRVFSNRSSRRAAQRQSTTARDFYRQRRDTRLADTGGNAASTRAVDAAVSWLVRHQDKSGRFDADGFMRHDLAGKPCEGRGGSGHDVGVTALAALALLAGTAESEPQASPRRAAIESSVAWLMSQQNRRLGVVGAGSGRAFAHGHVLATLALCEAFGAFGDKLVRVAAQSAVRYLERMHVKGKAWRYGSLSKESDAEITAWCIEALIAASDMGLTVDTKKLASAIHWLDGATDPMTGRTGYTARSVPPFRFASVSGGKSSRNSLATTAAALHARFLVGQRLHNSKLVKLAVPQVQAISTAWSAGSIDLVEWYFAAHALTGLGAAGKLHRGLREQLLRSQSQRGNANGSWDPCGVWGEAGGRVYSTAMCLLVLQAHKRTDPRHFIAGLSDDERLEQIRKADGKSYAELGAGLKTLGKRFVAKNHTDRGCLVAIQREFNVAVMSASRTVQRARLEKDPVPAGRILSQVASVFGDLSPGRAATEQLRAMESNPAVQREMTAAGLLEEIRAEARKGSSRRLTAKTKRLIEEFASTRAAEALLAERMCLNLHEGVQERPEGARILRNIKPAASRLGFALDGRGRRSVWFGLPARWCADIDQKGLRLRTTLARGNASSDLLIAVHMGEAFEDVADTVQSRVRSTSRTILRGKDVIDSELKVRGKRYATRSWIHKTKETPVTHKRIVLVDLGGAVAEFDYGLRRGGWDLDGILSSLKLRTGAPKEKSFQIQGSGWLFQGTLPGLVRLPNEDEQGVIRWRELDRAGGKKGELTLRIATAGDRSLRDALTQARGGPAGQSVKTTLWSSGRGLHWVLFEAPSTDVEGFRRTTAFARVHGELDLVWVHEGEESAQKRLLAILASLRGRKLPERR